MQNEIFVANVGKNSYFNTILTGFHGIFIGVPALMEYTAIWVCSGVSWGCS